MIGIIVIIINNSLVVVASPGDDMVYVSDGEFISGSDRGVDGKAGEDFGVAEEPRHKVYLNAFYIDKYEVTVGEYREYLKEKKKEYFIAVFLDSKNKIIKDEIISIGTLNSSLVHPREVFKEAIRNSANSIILLHNHPSGDCGPSPEDKATTEKLKDAGEIVGIKLLDHLIIGKNRWVSAL